MGTRAITKVIDQDGGVLVRLYRQYDGYPDGHGAELAEFLADAVIVNGIGLADTRKIFNGSGDVAARLVSFFKPNHAEIGGFYLVADDSWEDGCDYVYEVHVKDVRRTVSSIDGPGEVNVLVRGYSGPLFFGPVEAFAQWCKEDHDEE